MKEPRYQISADTWAYVDSARSKLVVEIDIPRELGNQNNQASKNDKYSKTPKEDLI
ncbi:MAG TPA: hypothetical protein VJC37_02655 [Planctomycetota bacterium]|nr:hypothetical protein [Planctomycetota bacterium]